MERFLKGAIVLAVLALVVMVCADALSEEQIRSDNVFLSTFPRDMFPADALRVDVALPPEAVETIEAEISMNVPGLFAVALTDGYHIALGDWWNTPTGFGCSFRVDELRRFDGLTGLWMVLFTKGE